MKVFNFLFLIALIWITACKNQCDLQSHVRQLGDTSKIYLYGEIRDLNTKEIMPNANLMIVGTKIGVMADPNGKYKLDITALTDTSKIYRFVCRYISYQVSHVTVKDKISKSTKLDIEMVGSDGSNYVTYKMDKKNCTLKMINRKIIETPPQY